MINLEHHVTGQILERFLEERGVSDDCPLCHEGVMSISVFDPEGDQAGDAPAVRVLHLLEDGTRRGYGQFLRVCSRCGYIHYIRDAEVLAFMEEERDNG